MLIGILKMLSGKKLAAIQLNEGLIEGYNKGLIEGQAAGEQKKQQEMVENLLKFGDSVEKISNVSGLSIDEVLKIKENLENNNS